MLHGIILSVQIMKNLKKRKAVKFKLFKVNLFVNTNERFVIYGLMNL